jgi:hypothetical protein
MALVVRAYSRGIYCRDLSSERRNNKTFILSNELKITLRTNEYWEELIAYFPLTGQGPHRKQRLQQFFGAAETSLPCCFLGKIAGYTDRPRDSLLIRHGSHRKWRVHELFIAAGTSLPSRCLATIGWIHVQSHRLMGGIYEVSRWDGLSWHDITPSVIRLVQAFKSW